MTYFVIEIFLKVSSSFNVRVFLFSRRSSFMYLSILGVLLILLEIGFSLSVFYFISLSDT